MADRLTDITLMSDDLDAIMAGVVSFEAEAFETIGEALGEVKKGSYAEASVRAQKDLKKLTKAAAKTAEEVSSAYYDYMAQAAEENDQWAAQYYEAAGVEQVPAAEDEALAAAVNSGVASAALNVQAKINTSALGLLTEQGELLPLADWYPRALTNAVNAMTRQELAADDFILRTVGQMVNGGFRIQKANGRSQEIYSVVRQDLLDNFTATMQNLRNEQGKQFGADGVMISAHSMCAPDHVDVQGQRMSKQEFSDLQASLERPIGEYNCRHFWSPILLSVKADDEEYLQALKDASEKEVTFKGVGGGELTMTSYQATQYQRSIELKLRKMRLEELTCTAAGADTGALSEDIGALEKKYFAMTKSAGLRTRYDRTLIQEQN